MTIKECFRKVFVLITHNTITVLLFVLGGQWLLSLINMFLRGWSDSFIPNTFVNIWDYYFNLPKPIDTHVFGSAAGVAVPQLAVLAVGSLLSAVHTGGIFYICTRANDINKTRFREVFQSIQMNFALIVRTMLAIWLYLLAHFFIIALFFLLAVILPGLGILLFIVEGVLMVSLIACLLFSDYAYCEALHEKSSGFDSLVNCLEFILRNQKKIMFKLLGIELVFLPLTAIPIWLTHISGDYSNLWRLLFTPIYALQQIAAFLFYFECKQNISGKHRKKIRRPNRVVD